MKEVILSADGDRVVYLVPDVVADNLKKHCLDFCTKWIQTDPRAKKYRKRGFICYNQNDFIDYLNLYVFPAEKSQMVCNLGWIESDDDLPDKYKDTPCFNF